MTEAYNPEVNDPTLLQRGDRECLQLSNAIHVDDLLTTSVVPYRRAVQMVSLKFSYLEHKATCLLF